MKGNIINGSLLAGLTLLTVVLANLPGRLALGLHESQFGIDAGIFVFVGLMADVHGFAPIMGSLVLVTWLSFVLLNKIFSGNLNSSALRIFVFGSLHLVIFTGCWIFSVAVSEFRLQRGPYPSFVDLHTGVDVGFISSALAIFFLDRYFWAAIYCLVALTIGFLIYIKYSSRASFRLSIPEIGGYVFTLTFFVFICFQLFIISPKLFAEIEDRSRLNSSLYFLELPTENILKTFYEGPNYRTIFTGLTYSLDDVAIGARMLGFNSAAIKDNAKLNCSNHPLAHPIPGFDEANDTKIELRRILIDLSEALFDDQTKPLTIWHILLESQRGDDIQALNKSALYEISPFINDIYKKGYSKNSNIIVAPFMTQAGLRTAQGLSAMMCGAGSLSFNLSISRDFGEAPLPLRCLPDVLKDASFHTSAFHGQDLSFDNMLAFFTYHGFDTYDRSYYEQLLAIRKMGPLPMGHWGISDIAVYDQALKIAREYPGDEPQYNFLITMSNHGPNGIPEDMPEIVTDRVMDALDKRNIKVGSDYITRLLTFAYADYALENAVANIRNGPGGEETIIIGLADHTIGDKFLWKKDSMIRGKELLLASARIPFFIILPEYKNVEKQEKLGKLVAELNEYLSRGAISQNDVPMIIMALLSRSSEFKSIDKDWRWSTVGGQQMNRAFTVRSSPKTVAWGIDTFSRLYLLDKKGNILANNERVEALGIDKYKRNKKIGSMQSVEYLKSLGKSMWPVASFLTYFMNGYGDSCHSNSNIRKYSDN